MYRVWLVTGALAGFLAVAAAALSAHALPQRLDAHAMGLFNTALALQSWHAPTLLLCGIWGRTHHGVLIHAAAALILAGLLAFCGAVYSLSFGWPLGVLAPVGGTTLMLGWLLLAGAALRG